MLPTLLDAACRHLGVPWWYGGRCQHGEGCAHVCCACDVCVHAHTILLTPTPSHYPIRCVHAINSAGSCVQALGRALVLRGGAASKVRVAHTFGVCVLCVCMRARISALPHLPYGLVGVWVCLLWLGAAHGQRGTPVVCGG